MKLSNGKIAAAVFALATIAYGVSEFRRPDGYAAFTQKREEARRLEAENGRIKDEIDRLTRKVAKIKTDPVAQELEVRRNLGLVKEGETVYLLQDRAARK
jgi:cell division protein FtsB